MAPFFWFLAPRELLPWKSVIGTVFNGFLALKLVYVLQFMGYYILRRWYYILRQLIGWSHYYILSQVVLHFEPAVYYILRRQVLHFAAGITFCADGITFCGRDYILRRYYILRQYKRCCFYGFCSLTLCIVNWDGMKARFCFATFSYI